MSRALTCEPIGQPSLACLDCSWQASTSFGREGDLACMGLEHATSYPGHRLKYHEVAFGVPADMMPLRELDCRRQDDQGDPLPGG